jgi:hypothetical protein
MDDGRLARTMGMAIGAIGPIVVAGALVGIADFFACALFRFLGGLNLFLHLLAGRFGAARARWWGLPPRAAHKRCGQEGRD